MPPRGGACMLRAGRDSLRPRRAAAGEAAWVAAAQPGGGRARFSRLLAAPRPQRAALSEKASGGEFLAIARCLRGAPWTGQGDRRDGGFVPLLLLLPFPPDPAGAHGAAGCPASCSRLSRLRTMSPLSSTCAPPRSRGSTARSANGSRSRWRWPDLAQARRPANRATGAGPGRGPAPMGDRLGRSGFPRAAARGRSRLAPHRRPGRAPCDGPVPGGAPDPAAHRPGGARPRRGRCG